MKKTFNLDPALLAEARERCGATTDTDTVRQALQQLIRHHAYQRSLAWFGTEPDAEDVPRRREPAAPRHRAKGKAAGR